ncbi:MAG: type VI secretion system protein TssA [Sulfuricurvum sp.]|uniref:type VI secretion system protein TssA n=1 Tax=Sulfuricurvum sp. TaxID=2025608 RepID=UPI002637A6B1|nr:type VI secretion system protein TssA [Sulfuricurvum sp.]MDD5158791.1 type VI secretion system protein TssA [Sulfuricurvum sp.]
MFELMINPLSDQSLCGVDAKYDDVYLLMESEIDKINSVAEGAQPNWQYVSNECKSLLELRTKDIKLLCWWAYAQYKLNGLSGFTHAIQTINQLLENFGKELFPKSNRAKWGALSWFETVMNLQLVQDRQVIVPIDEAEDFLTLLHSFQTLAKEVCETEDRLFSEACRLLEAKVSEKQQRDAAEKPKTPSIAVHTADNPSSGEITNDADAIKILNQLKKNAEQLTHYWRERQIDDGRALRMTRMISWLEIDALPLVQNGNTMLNAPGIERIEQIDSLISEGKNDAALQMIENVIFRSPFWLSGHHKAFEIYESIQKNKAAAEVKNMLISFITSNEGITELKFRDGTPFVPSQMKEWLNEHTRGGMVTKEGDTAVDALAIIGEQCYELVNKKNSKEAMEILQRSFRDAGSQEEKFQWRLLHAQVALAAGKPLMALALIEELEREIEHFSLEEWQPELVAKVYRFYLNSFNRTQIEREKYDVAFQRLCRVDMASAIDIK